MPRRRWGCIGVTGGQRGAHCGELSANPDHLHILDIIRDILFLESSSYRLLVSRTGDSACQIEHSFAQPPIEAVSASQYRSGMSPARASTTTMHHAVSHPSMRCDLRSRLLYVHRIGHILISTYQTRRTPQSVQHFSNISIHLRARLCLSHAHVFHDDRTRSSLHPSLWMSIPTRKLAQVLLTIPRGRLVADRSKLSPRKIFH